MDTDRHQREGELFDAACHLDREAQAAFLERECHGDALLLARVRALLARDARGDHALVLPSIAGAASALLGEHPPERLGRYRVLRMLGRGGMGVVYEAEQDHPRRSVAIKVLSSFSASPQSLRRFEHEARILARLGHPGIARVYDAGVAETALGPRPFLVMELVRGETLARHVASRALGRDERIELVARLCDAVQHAHEKGVVHRDLKPGNVLVDESGAPRVLDFGIARVLDDGTGDTSFRTRTGELLGTIAYMSPEQASGASALVDARSDVYALGVIAYELLAGRLPYDVCGKPLHDAVRVIAEEQPARLGSIARELRGDVETIVGKAIEKERERRYATAGDLALDLRRALRHESIQARPTSGLYQLRRFARRNRKLTTAAVLAAASLVAGTTVALVSAHRAHVSELGALARKGEADAARLEAEASALRANLATAALANELHDPIAARQALANVPESARGWEWRHASARVDDSALAIEDDARIVDAVASADGTTLVTVSATGNVRRWDARSGRALERVELGVALTGPASLAAGGAWLAAAHGEPRTAVTCWDVATGRVIGETTAADAVEAIATSPDGSVVAIGGRKPVLWSPRDGAVLPIRLARATAFAFDESGEGVACAYGAPPEHGMGWGWFVVADARTGALRGGGRKFSDMPLTGIALGPNSRWLAVSSSDRRAHALDRERPDETSSSFTGHRASVRCVAIDRDARRIATGSDDLTVRVWPLDGSAPLVLAGARESISRVAFLPDGSGVLATSGNGARVWRFDASDDVARLEGHTSFVYGVAFVADGRRLVSAAWDGTLRVWDARTRTCLGSRSTGSPRVFAVVAGPPDTWIATAEPGRVGLWSTSTLERVGELAATTRGEVRALSASRDGAFVAGRAVAGVVLWRASDRGIVRELARSGGNPTSPVALSPDARRVATGWGSTIVVWDATSGEELATMRGHARPVESLAFAPDGETLASGSRDETVRLWDTRTWTERAVLAGHTDRVYALAFTPDGARLASGSNDTSIRMWDAQGGASLAVLAGHRDYVYALAFAPDGESLASASGDATVRMWDTRPAASVWSARAEARGVRTELEPLVDAIARSSATAELAADRLRADVALDEERREIALQLLLERGLERPGR